MLKVWPGLPDWSSEPNMVCLQAEANKEGSSALKQGPQSVFQSAQKYVFIKVHALQWQAVLAYAYEALSSAWSTGNSAVMWHAQTTKVSHCVLRMSASSAYCRSCTAHQRLHEMLRAMPRDQLRCELSLLQGIGFRMSALRFIGFRISGLHFISSC
jgi:hypothetical protein